MKESFISKRFGPESLAIIHSAEAVINRYAAQGYDLSLRQLYYQFIAANLFPPSWIDASYNLKHGLPADTKNTEKNYKNLGGIISDARLAGLLDWDAIKDRGRECIEPSHWTSPQDIINSCAHGFRIDKWADQPNYVEVMVEKQALEGVLQPVCTELDINFMANKGYSSSSAMYEAGQRMEEKIRDEKSVHVIYLGDHDPSGMDMTRDIDDRLMMFTRADSSDEFTISVHRVALNMPQVRELNPPENPAKITDSRAAGYIERFGESSWELDAIEPRALAQIVREKVVELRAETLWLKAVRREAAMRDELLALAKKSKFK